MIAPRVFSVLDDVSAQDSELAALLCTAKESARVYLLVASRQKGCDGMGEFAMIKEEFGGVIDSIMRYSKEKKYIPEDVVWELNSAAEDMLNCGKV